MNGIRVIVDLDPSGTTVRGLVAGGRAGGVNFGSWLELMQTLERLLGEAQPADADQLDTEPAR